MCLIYELKLIIKWTGYNKIIYICWYLYLSQNIYIFVCVCMHAHAHVYFPLLCKCHCLCGCTSFSAPVKPEAALAGTASLSGCCLVSVLSWSEVPQQGQRLWQGPAGATLPKSYFVNPCLVPVRLLIHKNRKECLLGRVYLPFVLLCWWRT